jgi:hypothetical protein
VAGQRVTVTQDGAGSALAFLPNPIPICGSSGVPAAAIWQAKGATSIQVVPATGGVPIIRAPQGSGSIMTGPNTIETTVFYLQALDGSVPRTVAATPLSFAPELCANTGPTIAPNGVLHGAHFLAGPLARGQAASLFGSNLTARLFPAPVVPLPA